MSGFKHLERIDAYLDGRLEDGERHRFEADLLTDETLRAEYEACIAADTALEMMAFRGMLDRAKEGHKPVDKPANIFRFRWLFATLALLWLVVGWWFFKASNQVAPPQKAPILQDTLPVQSVPKIASPDSAQTPPVQNNVPSTNPSSNRRQHIALAKSLYKPLDFTSLRGNGTTRSDSAFVAFDNKQYQLAFQRASLVKKGEAGYMLARNVMAHAAFQLGDFEKSASIFQEIAKEAGDAGKQEQWFLLLSWLAAGKANTSDFVQLLAKIREDVWHPFHNDAKKIKL